jgi:hypothetical protein
MKAGTRGLLIAALVAALGGMASTASAQVYGQPEYVRTAVVIVSPGWHGDRYYDGRRYWARRDWERRHWRQRDRRHRYDHRGRRY